MLVLFLRRLLTARDDLLIGVSNAYHGDAIQDLPSVEPFGVVSRSLQRVREVLGGLLVDLRSIVQLDICEGRPKDVIIFVGVKHDFVAVTPYLDVVDGLHWKEQLLLQL